MRLKISTIAVISMMSLLFALAVSGQKAQVGAPGTDIPLYRNYDKTTGKYCFVYDRYVIKTTPSESEGDDIFVFRRNAAKNFKESCADSKSLPYMSELADDYNNFYGLAGGIFLIDSGTSAGERGLDVVSLISKKVVFSTSYMNDVKVTDNAVIYDKPSDKKGSLKACPEYRKWRKSGGEGWVQITRLDLATLKETSIGRLKCVYLE